MINQLIKLLSLATFNYNIQLTIINLKNKKTCHNFFYINFIIKKTKNIYIYYFYIYSINY